MDKNVYIAEFLDVSQAFAKFSHMGLLMKLSKYTITKSVLHFIQIVPGEQFVLR